MVSFLKKAVLSTSVIMACLMAAATHATEEGLEAPAFTLPGVRDVDSEITLGDLRGQIVYVDFWASWCAPCLRSSSLST